MAANTEVCTVENTSETPVIEHIQPLTGLSVGRLGLRTVKKNPTNRDIVLLPTKRNPDIMASTQESQVYTSWTGSPDIMFFLTPRLVVMERQRLLITSCWFSQKMKVSALCCHHWSRNQLPHLVESVAKLFKALWISFALLLRNERSPV